jgi:hypothetical protein
MASDNTNMASDDKFESGSVSDDEYVSVSMILTRAQIGRHRKRRIGPQAQSFNEYQRMCAKQKEAIRNGIRIGLCMAFSGEHILPDCWFDAIFDFLLEKITPAYSHPMIVKGLADFCKDNYSSDNVSAPIIARYVISCTNRQLFLLATSKLRARQNDRRENSKKRARESDGEENPEENREENPEENREENPEENREENPKAQAAFASLFAGGRPRGRLVVRGESVFFVRR